MAIIRQYDGWFGKHRWTVKVKYSTRTEKFTIALPEQAHDLFDKKELVAETQRDVERDYTLKSEQFKTASAVKTQVILVDLETENDNWESGVRLVLQCGVFEKQEWPNADKGSGQNIVYELLDSSLADEVQFGDSRIYQNQANDYTELVWSQETEDSIAKLAAAFIRLQRRLKAVCDTPESLIATLAGKKLLLGNLRKADADCEE